ncbi:MAG: enoyl-CoA hydratase/isomerase family protein [Alphaproteobacteria bacterium]|nr:enoyl-CoA hydratase/isomerase family protein [Alphaproteobacteria bacterium]
MAEELIVSRDGGIATVAFNRPEKKNALNLAIWRRLAEVMAELAADDRLRCVVLRGAGTDAFVAGADISEFETERKGRARGKNYGEAVGRALHAVGDCRHPTVAMIMGPCIGGGLEIATRCDIRVCGRSSKFGIPSNRLGLVISHAELESLVAVVGKGYALEILLTGELIDAARAEAIGLVQRVVADTEVEAEALKVARVVAERAPLTNRWHKKFLKRLTDPTPLTAAERDEAFDCYDSEDFKAGYQAFMAKTKPAFKGR